MSVGKWSVSRWVSVTWSVGRWVGGSVVGDFNKTRKKGIHYENNARNFCIRLNLIQSSENGDVNKILVEILGIFYQRTEAATRGAL